MSDPASLDLLNDIVGTETVSWWPPAPGWYVLASALGLLLLLLVWRSWIRWQKDRYRRLALNEFAAIMGSEDPMDLARLPALLKRTALSTWPRSQVAPLTGSEWHIFLDETAGTSLFGAGAGQLLDRLSYESGVGYEPSAAERESILTAAEFWLRRHQSVPAET